MQKQFHSKLNEHPLIYVNAQNMKNNSILLHTKHIVPDSKWLDVFIVLDALSFCKYYPNNLITYAI